jgi:hypothetical protein
LFHIFGLAFTSKYMWYYSHVSYRACLQHPIKRTRPHNQNTQQRSFHYQEIMDICSRDMFLCSNKRILNRRLVYFWCIKWQSARISNIVWSDAGWVERVFRSAGVSGVCCTLRRLVRDVTSLMECAPDLRRCIVWHQSLNMRTNSVLNFLPAIQYKKKLQLWFRYISRKLIVFAKKVDARDWLFGK